MRLKCYNENVENKNILRRQNIYAFRKKGFARLKGVESDMLGFIPEAIKRNAYITGGIVILVLVGVLYVITRGRDSFVLSGDYVIYLADSDAGILHAVQDADLPAEEAEALLPAREEPPAIMIVHVVGEVNAPGVIRLYEGARIDDAIEQAGGATDYADLSLINLAALVRDAMQITVPAFGEDAVIMYEEPLIAGDFAPASGGSSGGLVNINTATFAELQNLPGIGPTIAQNIIDFREAHGGFSNVEELINVSRIGQVTMDRLRTLVVV